LWVWNIQRNDVWITPEGRRLFGFSESESLNHERILNAIQEEHRPGVEPQIPASFAEGGEYEREYRVVLPGGETRWIAAIGRLELDPQGLPALMRGVTWDITERRLAELEKQQLQHEIAHVGRVSMMGQLASALAHEINQPLGAILRNAEAAELFIKSETPDLDEIRAILADIRRDDQRAGNVIDGMRAMLKRHVLDTQLLDMAELVRNVTSIARSDAATRQVKLNVNLPANLPQVRGDRVHLQQVLLNLILNGMDASNGESPPNRRVTVSARVDDARTMEIAISDSGHGIAAEQLAHIFDPFFTTKLDGMGMGLPISRTIIEAHGGRLWAENNNGSGGATFRFTLPPALEGATS
jgi:two-component system sensor kinase FixL